MDEQPHYRTIIFIRLAVGLIFVTQRTLKYIDPGLWSLDRWLGGDRTSRQA